MRANVTLFWNDNENVTRETCFANVYGVDFNQVAVNSVNKAREELLAYEPRWDGVDPSVTHITVVSHGSE